MGQWNIRRIWACFGYDETSSRDRVSILEMLRSDFKEMTEGCYEKSI